MIKCILNESTTLAEAVLKRLKEIAKGADLLTAVNIVSAAATLVTKFEES